MKKLLLMIAATVSISLSPAIALAQPVSQSPSPSPSSQSTPHTGKCGDTKTQIISCDSETGVGTINELIRIAIMVLTILIGAVAVGGLAYAAIIYASAQDNQSQVSEARTIIRNIIIGLILYVFTIAIINWLIPGSVIG